MKTTRTILAGLALMLAMAVAAPAQNAPTPAPGSGNQRHGQNGGVTKGKKTGPQDGSGPIHTPGTGGGTGAGNRKGRR